MLFNMPKNLGERYSPLYFLASVGAGGLTVTFFMYLMFWVPHAGRPVPIFSDIMTFWGQTNALGQAMIAIAMIGIAYFSYLNLRLLFWNLFEFSKFKTLDIYTKHQTSNAQTQVKAQALALAMSVNVLFIVGLVFVPGLWSIVEYLFPLAMIAFVAIGVLAFVNLGQFLGRVLVVGGFSCEANNSFAQLLPAFAFAMVGVGLSAPAAMSALPVTTGISVILSTFFFMAAAILAAIALVMGFRSMMENGAAEESAPTLLIVIPLLTVLGILMLRQNHGLHLAFDMHSGAGETFVLLTRILSVQFLFGLLGMMILRRQNYASKYLNGDKKSVGAYALICPGVALSVMLQFFINKGLVATQMIDKFSAIYWVLTIVAIGFQVGMILLMIKINKQHFGHEKTDGLIAAE